jgi:pimeloyl-ACP methyl ester carboxylesterase
MVPSRWGDGMADTVLLIHGYGCAGDVWGPVAARLRAEGYRVEAPTIRSAVRTVEGLGPASRA